MFIVDIDCLLDSKLYEGIFIIYGINLSYLVGEIDNKNLLLVN